MKKLLLHFIIIIIIMLFVIRVFFINITPYYISDITSLIRVICILSMWLITFIYFIRYLIYMLFPLNESYFGNLIIRFMSNYLYSPLRSFIISCLSYEYFQKLCLNLGFFLVEGVCPRKLFFYLFIFCFFIGPRILYVLSLYVDIFILEQIRLTLKHAFIISSPLIVMVIVYFIYFAALQERARLEKDFLTPEQEGSRILLTAKNKDTRKEHFDSWDLCTLIIDRSLAIVNFCRKDWMLGFYIFCLFLILCCYTQYICLLVSYKKELHVF